VSFNSPLPDWSPVNPDHSPYEEEIIEIEEEEEDWE